MLHRIAALTCTKASVTRTSVLILRRILLVLVLLESLEASS